MTVPTNSPGPSAYTLTVTKGATLPVVWLYPHKLVIRRA